MKVTREQIYKWNKGNENGFELNINTLLMRGEKESTKKIPLDNNHVLVCTVLYRAEYETVTQSNRVTYNRPTFRHIPCLHFDVSLIEGSFLVSHGLGYWYNMGASVDKKNYNALKKLTETLDDDTCMSIFENLKATKVNALA